MLDRLSFVIGEAMTALRRNGFMTFAAISTVAVSLFLLGGLGYGYLRVVEYANSIPGKFDMRVYLRQGVDPNTISQTAATIRGFPGVASVAWIPKEKAWAKEKKDDPANTVGIENPYPDGFKITIKTLKDGDPVAEKIRRLAVIDPEPGVIYLKDEQHLIDEGLQVMRWLGTFIASLLFVTAGVLIFNAIKLTITYRRREIRIMQLVGASRFMVQVPFLIEGTVQGILGGIISAIMLGGAQQVFQKFLMDLDARVHLSAFPGAEALVILGGVGGIYGLFCSWLAITLPNRAQ
ncbi:MAG: permease-like cell division protein FtsX [Fimbriimonas sp.]|nr:permease-like cell division protein FtsX [Fimbriimonas sp.]